MMEDVATCLSLYEAARGIMRSSGNMSQWTNGYPSREVLENDIINNNSYVICDNEEIVGTFACIVGEDPTYSYIEDGEWQEPTLPYATIHRLASTSETHGIAKAAFDYAIGLAPSMRADTHADNHIMQHILEKYGFARRGTIYLANGDPRVAYQFTIDN